MLLLQIVTLILLISSTCQNTRGAGRPKCCSDSLSHSIHKKPWTETLREATYQSIIRHLDFTGTLDGRLDRDHALWKHLKEAKYITDDDSFSTNSADDIRTGVLLEKPKGDRKPSFEFRQTDKLAFDCSRKECYPKNNSLLALWRVRRTDNPNALWVRVKLPNIGESPIEDVYEYSRSDGLKKINPDPLEYNAFKGERGHRFSLSTNKGEIKGGFTGIDRMDFRFPGLSKGFGMGRVGPATFSFDFPIRSSKGGDDWIFSSPRKSHPGVVFETGVRSYNKGSPFDSQSGPFIASGPHGFHHVIHSLPSIPPSQNLDNPNHDFKGFLPSTRPISPPSPYKTEYAYDPRYVLYYSNPPNMSPEFTTSPPRYFKPSTEFVRYSEIDPFYHPDGETDLLQTTPMPFPPNIPHFPNSINEQLPIGPPIGNPNPGFKIIVGDLKPNFPTTTETPVTTKKLPPIKQVTKPRLNLKPQNKTKEQPNSVETSTKAFGEKIRPKVSATPKTTTAKPNLMVDYTDEATRFDSEKEKTSTITTDDNESPPNNFKITINEVDQIINNELLKVQKTNATQNTDVVKTETFNDSTTEENEKKTTFFDFVTTTEIINKEVLTNGSLKATSDMSLSTETTDSEFEPTVSTTLLNTSNDSENNTTDEWYTDETTETNSETTTDILKTTSEGDFFSSLTNSFFAPETTTPPNVETNSTLNSPPQDDSETQESKQGVHYRLLTFPGDSVSIVANRISKTVSYRTAAGDERKLQTKQPIANRYRFSDFYKDYSTIL